MTVPMVCCEASFMKCSADTSGSFETIRAALSLATTAELSTIGAPQNITDGFAGHGAPARQRRIRRVGSASRSAAHWAVGAPPLRPTQHKTMQVVFADRVDQLTTGHLSRQAGMWAGPTSLTLLLSASPSRMRRQLSIASVT
jgi:hypothetical protein